MSGTTFPTVDVTPSRASRPAREDDTITLEPVPAPEAAVPHSRFRGDIEGLRAVAVGLVLLYHAGLPFLPGGYVGVDVFFVISGFLITTQLLSEVRRTGSLSLTGFYARRAKRLFPGAVTVLVASMVLVRLFTPKIRWEEIGGDIVASALYVVNWRLADRSVDYLAEDSQPSPVQHFWSLAVEEQFYFVWPLLILAVVLIARRLRRGHGPILWIGLAAVAVPSFVWALLETARSPEQAFFITTTRMWELAIGAGVALGAGGLARMRRTPALLLGWAGLAAIVTAALVFTSRTPWPGYAAALPTLGTAAVIAAGFAVTRGGPETVLGTSPFRWVGALSYSLYLWHWPLLVIAPEIWDGDAMTRGLLVVLASVVPAWITYRWIENPIRHSKSVSRSPKLALSIGANLTLAGVVSGLVLLLFVANAAVPVNGAAPPGAAVLKADPRDDPAGRPQDRVDLMMPDPLRAVDDVPHSDRTNCIQQLTKAVVNTCSYGNPQGAVKVAVTGDSKVTQWMPALEVLAARNDWNLVVYAKSSCSLTTAIVADKYDKPYDTCTSWNRDVLPRLVAEKPDYVITSQASPAAIGPSGELSVDLMVAGMRESWAALIGVGAEIIVVADNPHPGMNVYECVEEHPTELSQCTYSRDRRDTKGGYSTQVIAVKDQPHVRMIDLYDAICPTERCAPVIGNVLVYRAGSHVTATYVRTMTPRLAAALTAAGLPAESGS